MLGLPWRAAWEHSKWEVPRACQEGSLCLMNTFFGVHREETGRLGRCKDEVTNESLKYHWMEHTESKIVKEMNQATGIL